MEERRGIVGDILTGDARLGGVGFCGHRLFSTWWEMSLALLPSRLCPR